ncbi:hypothetical protein [Streptomyces sp. AK02-01A]|uniref:hypothetical protein n=1 Tax=Streptomyces sp. AK02-01A TaxID=3028648 RepID=UPI0029B26035|nr:hypothetical protein [Streptomyces sp. AK02-01A]MDX3855294.1 hypothetical protein [Streptomyces sp. AK02-01A]
MDSRVPEVRGRSLNPSGHLLTPQRYKGIVRPWPVGESWLLHLYLLLLAVVAALPFPTRLVSEYGDTAVVTSLYAAVIVLAVVLLSAMSARLLFRRLDEPETGTPGTAPAAARPTD